MFYTCVLKAKVGSDDIINVFYYRDQNLFTWPNAIMGGAEALSEAFRDDVLTKIKGILPDSWVPQQIVVYPHNELFEWSSQVPFTLGNLTAHNGLVAANTLKGNALCINLNYTVRPSGPQGGFLPPRRGYTAFGPLPAHWVTENATVNPETFVGRFADVQSACSSNISDLVFNIGQFVPIRVRHNRVLGSLVKWKAFADIASASWATHVSWRRSRMPE
jgi:hypothetical protein